MNSVSLFAKRVLACSIVVVVSLLALPSAYAHETPIALLDVRESQPGVYLLQWTYSSSTNLQAPTPIFPEHCIAAATRLNCGEQGLFGRLSFERLGVSYSAVVVRITRLGEETRSYTLTGAESSLALTKDGKLPWTQVASAYVPLGIEHILLGIDHLLFVLGLLVLVRRLVPLAQTITAFTIAHSITLAAATLGWIGVPEAPVNAAIALSIVILGVEIVKGWRGEVTWSSQYPWAVAFGFGLLHGLGFATALTDIGLSKENVPLALLFFNVGVEIGQLGFVFVVAALAWAHRNMDALLPGWTHRAAVYGLSVLASYWFVARFVDIALPPVVL